MPQEGQHQKRAEVGEPLGKKDVLIGFDKESGRIPHKERLGKSRHQGFHIDNGGHPEPDLDQNSNELPEVPDENIKNGKKEAEGIGEYLLYGENEGDKKKGLPRDPRSGK